MSKIVYKENFFDTDEKKAAAFPSLKQLQESQGWKIIESVLFENITVNKAILETTKFSDLRDVDDIQNLIAAFNLLVDLPAKLLELCSDSKAVASYDGDPYDKVEEQPEDKTIRE